jgi:gluconate 2-dehydrogenase subunit 3-like protein
MAYERREALKIIGAIGTSCVFSFPAAELYAQHAHHDGVLHQIAAVPAAPKVFSKDEFDFLSVLTDLIIPPTDTPGASQAGVPAYIDYVAGTNAGRLAALREGFALLDGAAGRLRGRKFLELQLSDQIDILKPLSDAVDGRQRAGDADVEFFRTLKNLTADGYYTSQTGLVTELGYTGNSVHARFSECEIPSR